MADKKNKPSRKNIRKQRWAAVVAGILALGMLVSLFFIYFDYMTGSGGAAGSDQGIDLEEYLEYYKYNAEQLEEYIEEHGPTQAVLESLAESYNSLIMLQQLFAGESESEEIPALQSKLVVVYESLIELIPSDLRYRIELLHAYRSIDADEDIVLEQAVLLGDLLRESPKSTVHLQLINFLSLMDVEQLMDEEISWFKTYLEQRIEDEAADNIDRYCLAILLAEYMEDTETAYAQLALILETEEEGSSLYNEAMQYKEKLEVLEETPDDDNE